MYTILRKNHVLNNTFRKLYFLMFSFFQVNFLEHLFVKTEITDKLESWFLHYREKFILFRLHFKSFLQNVAR